MPGKPTWRDWIDIAATLTTAYFVADAFHLVDDTVHGDYESASWDALALALDAPRGLFHAAEPKPRRGQEPEGHAPTEDGPSCTRNSFKADTPVLLVHGKTKPIGKIKPGDRVESADPGNGKHQGPRTVTAQLVHHDRDLVNVTIRHDNGHTAILHTTSHHPFWDATLHAWVQAGNLTAGHALTTATDRHIRIVSVHALTGAADMYNLTVADLHTYYVLAGATPVLVHNSGGDSRFRYLDRSGFSNYTLVDASGRTYYSGMFGPNDTAAGVMRRHSNNNNRFNPANGDSIRVVPGTRTYGESRLMEQRLAEQHGTIIGRSGNDYRGNRQNPLDGKKLAEYEGYEAKKSFGGC
ncbi:polymorphic toxin-type HINT domain-containing protein [Streptomyces sp. LN590]|uniref:polymorphic toxin-type HINT domain-containing protein n=1 Tax=Streptomyces sp. LN590 TaxID=3112980 RepID=UPI00371FDE33